MEDATMLTALKKLWNVASDERYGKSSNFDKCRELFLDMMPIPTCEKTILISEIIEPLFYECAKTWFYYAMHEDSIDGWKKLMARMEVLGYVAVINNAVHCSLAYGNYSVKMGLIAEDRIKYLESLEKESV